LTTKEKEAEYHIYAKHKGEAEKNCPS